MSTTDLYARRSTPFVLGHIGPNKGKILDLRIHWTAANIVDTVINDVAPGETRLINTAEDQLTFAARHPIYTDVYFSLSVDGKISQYLEYLTTNSGAYQVNTSSGMTAYLVKNAGGTVGLALSSPQTIIMLDLEYTDWVDTGINTGLVEPFNVIFDYIPQTVKQTVPKFIYGGSSMTISGSYFTNTPTSGGAILPTAHRFSLVGDTLVFLDKPAIVDPPNKIISINGVRADHGGITIKTLI